MGVHSKSYGFQMKLPKKIKMYGLKKCMNRRETILWYKKYFIASKVILRIMIHMASIFISAGKVS